MKTCENETAELVVAGEVLPSGGGDGGTRDQQMIEDRARQLMLVNEQMFDMTVHLLAKQNAALLAENTTLRHEVEETQKRS